MFFPLAGEIPLLIRLHGFRIFIVNLHCTMWGFGAYLRAFIREGSQERRGVLVRARWPGDADWLLASAPSCARPVDWFTRE